MCIQYLYIKSYVKGCCCCFKGAAYTRDCIYCRWCVPISITLKIFDSCRSICICKQLQKRQATTICCHVFVFMPSSRSLVISNTSYIHTKNITSIRKDEGEERKSTYVRTYTYTHCSIFALCYFPELQLGDCYE
jgi:hypothetical protein